MPRDANDWLWRLECVEEQLAQALPTRDLRLHFFLVRDASRRHYSDEMQRLDNCLAGKSLATHSFISHVCLGESALWFELGGHTGSCFIKWDDEREELRYFPSVPKDGYARFFL